MKREGYESGSKEFEEVNCVQRKVLKGLNSSINKFVLERNIE
jgi:hypothetical protein